jgi:hypothetical protein
MWRAFVDSSPGWLAKVVYRVGSGDGQRGVVVILLPPRHVVPVERILLDAEHGRFVRVVANPLRGEQDLIEEAAMALAGVDPEAASEQTHAVAVVRDAAVHALIAVDEPPAIAHLEGLRDVVIAVVLTARQSHLRVRGSDRLLCRRRACQHQGQGQCEIESGQHRVTV